MKTFTKILFLVAMYVAAVSGKVASAEVYGPQNPVNYYPYSSGYSGSTNGQYQYPYSYGMNNYNSGYQHSTGFAAQQRYCPTTCGYGQSQNYYGGCQQNFYSQCGNQGYMPISYGGGQQFCGQQQYQVMPIYPVMPIYRGGCGGGGCRPRNQFAMSFGFRTSCGSAFGMSFAF